MMDAGTLDFATFMNTMRNGDDSKGNIWIWLIFILFFFGGAGGNGLWGRGDRTSSAVEQQLSNDFVYSNLSGQIRGVNEGIIQGFSGLNTNVLKEAQSINSNIAAASAFNGERFNGIDRGLCNLGYELKSTIDNCCCTTQKAIQQFGYENQLGILNQTNALNQSISLLGDKIDNQTATMLKEFCAIKSREDERQIAQLTAQLNDMKTANMLSAQTANLTSQLSAIQCSIPPKPVPAYITGGANTYGYGYGIGYGFPYPCNCTGSTVTATA